MSDTITRLRAVVALCDSEVTGDGLPVVNMPGGARLTVGDLRYLAAQFAQEPSPEEPKPPASPFEIEIHAHGETWDDALREVEDSARHIRQHGPECNRAGGGGGRSGYITVRTVPGLTLEAYRAALAEWFEKVAPKPADGGGRS